MKNALLFICLMLGIYQAEAQIIITGFYTEPPHEDAPVSGGFEYMQFKATENINFSTNNYCIVVAGNSGQLVTANGWAGPDASTNHYKFNLTSGSVAKGDFFYVGNTMKQINGTFNGNPSTDISNAKWIRTINTGTVNGDDNIGKASTVGFLPYAATTACGIAVFSGTTVTSTTVPIDAVFYGDNIGQSNFIAPDKGYLVPVNNGLYNDGNGTQKYFGQGTNTTLVGPRSTSNDNQFYMIGGMYNTGTKVWTGRAGSRVKLTATSQLSDIETGNGIVTLPVELLSFNAQKTTSGVELKWSTSSEKNNNRFDVLHSTDGHLFSVIGSVKGHGSSTSLNNYSFTDKNPSQGTNYYQLEQFDHDGKTEKSTVAAVNTDSSQPEFIIAQTENEQLFAKIFTLEKGSGYLKIIDMGGRELLTVHINLEQGNNRVDIPSIKAGIYTATLTINNKNRSNLKFVK